MPSNFAQPVIVVEAMRDRPASGSVPDLLLFLKKYDEQGRNKPAIGILGALRCVVSAFFCVCHCGALRCYDAFWTPACDNPCNRRLFLCLPPQHIKPRDVMLRYQLHANVSVCPLQAMT